MRDSPKRKSSACGTSRIVPGGANRVYFRITHTNRTAIAQSRFVKQRFGFTLEQIWAGKQRLCFLSCPAGKMKKLTEFSMSWKWSGRDSNSRPLQCDCSALPTELPPLEVLYSRRCAA